MSLNSLIMHVFKTEVVEKVEKYII